jgi:hypothetical protein
MFLITQAAETGLTSKFFAAKSGHAVITLVSGIDVAQQLINRGRNRNDILRKKMLSCYLVMSKKWKVMFLITHSGQT